MQFISYYGLEGTLRSWHDALRPDGRVFIQSGNIGLPYMPTGSWIIDETVDAIDAAARKIVGEDDRWSTYRSTLDDTDRMQQYDALRKKYFLPVRPVDYYLGALESSGFQIQEVTHLPIEAHVDQWYEFLATYHEGVLGWVGGVKRIEGQEPDDAVVQDRLSIIREAMDVIFDKKPSFQALWSYIHASRMNAG